MLAFIMECHIIIQRSVDTSGTQSVGDCPQAEGQKGMADGESEKCGGGDRHADGGYFSCPQFFSQTVALKTGDNGSQGNDYGDDPCRGTPNSLYMVGHAEPRRESGSPRLMKDR